MSTGRMGMLWLAGAAAVTVALWRLPYGAYLLYPFSALATWFHEMGHGLTALALGGSFERLLLFSDLSGKAVSGGALGGAFGRAAVSAGGPMGSAVAGFLLMLASRRFFTARLGLFALGAAVWISCVVWVRTPFGIGFTLLAGAAILAAAWRGPKELHGFLVQFLGVQAAISTFSQLDYLFTYEAMIGGEKMLSDSARVGQALWLPYWLCGGVLAAASLGLLGLGLYLAYREPAKRATAS